jgi:hypothetical protein
MLTGKKTVKVRQINTPENITVYTTRRVLSVKHLLRVHSLPASFDAVNLYTFDIILVRSQPKGDKRKMRRILIKK